jgi:hypothetical protein
MTSPTSPTADDPYTGGTVEMTPAEHDSTVEAIHRIRESIAESHGFDLKWS